MLDRPPDSFYLVQSHLWSIFFHAVLPIAWVGFVIIVAVEAER